MQYKRGGNNSKDAQMRAKCKKKKKGQSSKTNPSPCKCAKTCRGDGHPPGT